ncbi:MAG TPA: SUMF1/EgtB/PvdO family nonheme iron enzyme [Candidatus Acidoferrales bacterium]|nr:SUMF1/EgtB/PvdO family nonheme iron enzyme [Candidatus Acidoferrales bacterium]
MDRSRARTDALFHLLPPASFCERPIPERHRLIFYLGHLEAFDWNLLANRCGMQSDSPELDQLFAFGIDPVAGALPSDTPGDWPSLARIEQYNRNVRTRLDERLRQPDTWPSAGRELRDGTLLHVAIEHRLMHAETIAYLFHNLPFEKKGSHPLPQADATPAPAQRHVEIPAGVALLGQSRHDGTSFGWDNEFGAQHVFVPAFAIDAFPVTNAQYLEFVRSGGYDDPRHWRVEDWEWMQRQGRRHPHFWGLDNGAAAADPKARWKLRAMFGEIPLPPSWPVYVSHAEAAAFARWAGKSLPTEAQWQRAAYGAPDGADRAYPWGNSAPDPSRGNFHYQGWDSAPVDKHPAGASAYGVFDLLGNGWEWTSTPFAPLPGFEPFSFYPGYSANFFDGKHFVMKGGSPRTDACMMRRSFRNWFQPHYPYVYATFRCVEE